MNTRSFLKSLLVAAVAPQVLVPKAEDAFKWKRSDAGMWIPNPAFDTAQYQVVFFEYPWREYDVDIPEFPSFRFKAVHPLRFVKIETP